jgi:hypothetical protein
LFVSRLRVSPQAPDEQKDSVAALGMGLFLLFAWGCSSKKISRQARRVAARRSHFRLGKPLKRF